MIKFIRKAIGVLVLVIVTTIFPFQALSAQSRITQDPVSTATLSIQVNYLLRGLQLSTQIFQAQAGADGTVPTPDGFYTCRAMWVQTTRPAQVRIACFAVTKTLVGVGENFSGPIMTVVCDQTVQTLVIGVNMGSDTPHFIHILASCSY